MDIELNTLYSKITFPLMKANTSITGRSALVTAVSSQLTANAVTKAETKVTASWMVIGMLWPILSSIFFIDLNEHSTCYII